MPLAENMEVLVAWSHTRYGPTRVPRSVSRMLILLLAVVLGVGAFFYLRNLKSSSADDGKSAVGVAAAGQVPAAPSVVRNDRPPTGALLAPGGPATRPAARPAADA